MKLIKVNSFDLVSNPAFSNSRIYPKEIYKHHLEELDRRMKRKIRKEKIKEIFGDDIN